MYLFDTFSDPNVGIILEIFEDDTIIEVIIEFSDGTRWAIEMTIFTFIDVFSVKDVIDATGIIFRFRDEFFSRVSKLALASFFASAIIFEAARKTGKMWMFFRIRKSGMGVIGNAIDGILADRAGSFVYNFVRGSNEFTEEAPINGTKVKIFVSKSGIIFANRYAKLHTLIKSE
jgi:hypothetical protein